MFEYTTSIDLEQRIWARSGIPIDAVLTDAFTDYLRRLDQVKKVHFNSNWHLVITFESEAAATMFLMKHA